MLVFGHSILIVPLCPAVLAFMLPVQQFAMGTLLSERTMGGVLQKLLVFGDTRFALIAFSAEP